jgi:hypothetical protein
MTMQQRTFLHTRRIFTALSAIALLSACGLGGEPGEVYAKSGSEVRQTLAGIDTLPPIFGSNVVETSVMNNGDGSITWTASQGYKPLLRFVAQTEEVDAGHTRVVVGIKGATDAADDPTAKRLAENPTIRDLYLAAMVEQVDATLEGREFDFSAISGKLAIATAANIGQMSANLDKVVAEEQRREAENVARAYEQEASGDWGDTPDGW